MEPRAFTGSQASCKVFATDLEPTAETQITTFLDCPAFAGCQIRIMPDVHAGAGAVIGFTSPVGPGVCPNVIGVDIGCGVLANRVGIGDVDFAALDAYIRKHVPSGFVIHQHPHALTAELEHLLAATDEIATRIGADPEKVRRSLGTLGGGNHFIEVGRADSDGALWLAIRAARPNVTPIATGTDACPSSGSVCASGGAACTSSDPGVPSSTAPGTSGLAGAVTASDDCGATDPVQDSDHPGPLYENANAPASPSAPTTARIVQIVLFTDTSIRR